MGATGGLNVLEAAGGGFFVVGKVDVDEIQKEFGGVDVKRHGVANISEIRLDSGNGPGETKFPSREEIEFIEEGEGGGRGLVNASNYDDLENMLGKEDTANETPAHSVFSRHFFEIRHHLVTCCRV